MIASMLDLRRRMREVLSALARNESVTILYRGKERGVIHPSGARAARPVSASAHAAFGMWAERADLRDVREAVRRLRKPRTHDV